MRFPIDKETVKQDFLTIRHLIFEPWTPSELDTACHIVAGFITFWALLPIWLLRLVVSVGQRILRKL